MSLEQIMSKLSEIDARYQAANAEHVKAVSDLQEKQTRATDEMAKRAATAEALCNELKAEQKALLDRIGMMEAKSTATAPNLNGATKKSAGAMFIESAEFKSMIERGETKSGRFRLPAGMELKTILNESGATSLGALIHPQIDPTIYMTPRIQPMMAGLFTHAPANSDSITFMRATGEFAVSTTLTAGVAQGVAVLPVADTSGFGAGQIIYVDGEQHTVLSVNSGALTITMTAGIVKAAGVLNGDRVYSAHVMPTVESTTTATSIVGRKPEAELTFSETTISIGTIASWIPITRQGLADAAGIQSIIDTFLAYNLELAEDWQILSGSGTAPQYTGILNDPGIQNYSQSSHPGDTIADAIRRAVTLCRLSRLPATFVTLHPNQLELLEMLKDNTNNYLKLVVNGVIWRLQIVETEQIADGTGLVGSNLGAIIRDRQDTQLYMSDSHANFFIENKIAMLAEKRGALQIVRPAAFVAVSFDGAPIV